jgi:hypothetical protein
MNTNKNTQYIKINAPYAGLYYAYRVKGSQAESVYITLKNRHKNDIVSLTSEKPDEFYVILDWKNTRMIRDIINDIIVRNCDSIVLDDWQYDQKTKSITSKTNYWTEMTTGIIERE